MDFNRKNELKGPVIVHFRVLNTSSVRVIGPSFLRAEFFCLGRVGERIVKQATSYALSVLLGNHTVSLVMSDLKCQANL